MQRGVYSNINRGRQLLLFDGMQYGNITPTDFDAVIEYKNRLWVVFEAKLAGKDVPIGQKLALERFVQDIKGVKKHGVALVVEHNTNLDEDIILRDCLVRELFSTEGLEWRKPRKTLTAKQAADEYISHFAGGQK